MIFRKPTLEDYHKIELQEAQKSLQQRMLEINEDSNVFEGDSWAMEKDGIVLAIGGFVPIWEGRYYSWLLISKDIKKLDFIPLFRYAISTLKGKRRIETTMDMEFKEALRWIEMLGYKKEGILKSYTPDGKDEYLYARIE